MQTFFFALFAFLLVMTIMAVGVIMGRKPISGSCGGVGAALGEDDYVCDICGGDPNKCEEQGGVAPDSQDKPAADFYDASK